MKKYAAGMLVTFNNNYVEILKAYQHLPFPKQGWDTYMHVFKNHYEGLFEKIGDLQSQKVCIVDVHEISLVGNTWFYYSVKTVNEDVLPFVIIPEFLEETYNQNHALGHNFEAFRVGILANFKLDDFFGDDLPIPNEAEVEYKWKSYTELKQERQMEDTNYKKINIPNFELKPYKFKIINERGTDTILKYGFKFYDNYALIPEGNLFKKVKVHNWNGELSSEECIKYLSKVKIKDYTKSADIFGYKPSKKEMFESNTLFKVNNIMFNYESKKTNTKLDVVELDNGVKSLKFVLEDLEFVFKEPKGFNVPSKININKIRKKDVQGKTVRIVRDKGLPVKKNDRAVLVDMWNNHQPLTGSRFERREVSWDKDTKVKLELDNKQTIICKLKNIKFVK